MAIFRVEKHTNYSIMSNSHLRDKSLSWKAKGVLSDMLSLPDDWDYSLDGLSTLSSDGMSATRSAIKELEEHGYLMRKPIREKGKIVDWEYTIFEKPLVEKPLVENPQVEKPQVEKPLVENRTQLNTNKLNTKELIEEIINYLNSRTGSSYRATTPKTKSLIKSRLSEGFDVEDFKRVIDNKTASWKGTEWEKYLRPETLFGTKFESYLNENQTATSKQQADDTDILGMMQSLYETFKSEEEND